MERKIKKKIGTRNILSDSYEIFKRDYSDKSWCERGSIKGIKSLYNMVKASDFCAEIDEQAVSDILVYEIYREERKAIWNNGSSINEKLQKTEQLEKEILTY